MRTLIDFDSAPIFAISVSDGVGQREGMLLEGPQGWGEFSPPADSDETTLARWLTAAIEVGTVGWPDPVRGRVPIAVRVPAVDPVRAHQIVAGSGCATAEVVVAANPGSLADDIARLEAVRDALGAGGTVRVDADGGWDVETAVSSIAALSSAAGGLEYVEQPCRTLDELAAVRRRVQVMIAADQSLRDPRYSAGISPGGIALTDAADIAVLACAPLGGARRALRVAEVCGLPCVVSSSMETSIGLAAGLALAGALPALPYACGLGTRTLLDGDVVAASRSLAPIDGYLPVAPMPAAPDPDLLRRFAVIDADSVTRWRRILGAARNAQ